MVIGVLALQGDVREHVRALDEAGATARPVRRLSEIESVDGLVIPGGESTTLWRLATAFDLLDPVRKIIADGMPAFGSCAGLIMLADRLRDGVEGQQTFGGIDITARRNAFGRQVDSFERDIFLRLDSSAAGPAGAGPAGPAGAGHAGAANQQGTPFHAVFIRAPWVEQAGEEVTVLGEDNGRIIAVRQGPLLATAFHPELTQDRRIHELFVKMVKGTS
ncbi:MAG TPA: pyridoxal 5'-phosphate synthase glutaminase subunit PdxT [Trebonia sp.]|nr:pyridoxal 5'-phosphate synthase glutaminase subunit PdxT [Trebonia sp.]